MKRQSAGWSERHDGVPGKAVQVDHQVDPGLKALGFQPVESTSLSKFWFQMVNLHPYIQVEDFAPVDADNDGMLAYEARRRRRLTVFV